jgi:hypothetical protein
VHGHPLLIYSSNNLGQGADANGPLGLIPLVPIVTVANLMGWSDNVGLRSGITDAVFACFALLLAVSAVRIVERARGRLEWRLAAPCVFLLAPALWISVGDYGHVEQPIELCLVLLAAGYALERRSVAAGIALGLAVLTRSTVVLYVIPLAAVAFATRRVRPTAVVLSVAAITAAVGFAPFLAADGANVVHSLLTYRGGLAVGGGSFWVAARGTGWAALGQHGDTYLIFIVAACLSGAVVWRRSDVAITIAGFFGLLTVVATCFPLLAKATYPYYLLEPYVFAAIWWLARPGSALNWRLTVPVLLTADALISKQAATLPFDGPGLIAGVASSILLAVVMALVLGDLIRTRASPAHNAGGHAMARDQRAGSNARREAVSLRDPSRQE